MSFVLGHNFLSFDRPFLEATKPDLRLLNLPVVDTLRLSPLAFPRNPYHSLVKHYKDGGIKQGQLNDPELDSRLALTVFYDQLEEFRKVSPDLLAAWHWLCTPQPEGPDYALDEMFCLIRQTQRPTQVEASIAIERLLGLSNKANRSNVQIEAYKNHDRHSPSRRGQRLSENGKSIQCANRGI